MVRAVLSGAVCNENAIIPRFHSTHIHAAAIASVAVVPVLGSSNFYLGIITGTARDSPDSPGLAARAASHHFVFADLPEYRILVFSLAFGTAMCPNHPLGP